MQTSGLIWVAILTVALHAGPVDDKLITTLPNANSAYSAPGVLQQVEQRCEPRG